MVRMTGHPPHLPEVRWPGELRPYQKKALSGIADVWDRGDDRTWVVLPPGAGKTLVGLEAARRLGRPIVVLTPNTAIQAQWAAHWSRYAPEPSKAGTDRRLNRPVTVLNYQSLAVFDPDVETDEDGGGRPLTSRLHARGRELVAGLREAGPITVVLDECHHLLDVWGRLLAEVLDELADARVIGLTATPPESLTSAQSTLVDELFGTPILGASIPALIRDGYLAPFAELAWLTEPTREEADYIAGAAERFAELRTGLLSPDFARTGFLAWLDARFVTRTTSGGPPVPWDRLLRDTPDLADAALRFQHAGLLAPPPGARVREQHRREPDAADWMALLDDYLRHCLLPSDDDTDRAAIEAIRRALPSIGYRLTKRGLRTGRSPVDRVLARSEAKARACAEIAIAEDAALGDRLRLLTLCDHERAGAKLPAELHGVLDTEAGSAWLALRTLAADPRTARLAPMLVTGRTLAAGHETAAAFAAWVATRRPDLPVVAQPADTPGLSTLSARWTARTWTPLVTRYFEEGGCRALIGTRGLLGEGWDAHGVNALVDLTAAATGTAVVQTRGRALRLNPDAPQKVAHNWTVVCVCEGHPKATADWGRFVRKHDAYFAAAVSGEVVRGVAHVDTGFTPHAPPPAAEFTEVNARMLVRAEDRSATRAAWRIGTPYQDRPRHTIRVHARGAAREPEPEPADAPLPPALVPDAVLPRPRRSGRPDVYLTAAVSALVCAGVAAVGIVPGAGTALFAAVVIAVGAVYWWIRSGADARALRTAATEPSVLRFGYAVADGLAEAGLARHGAPSVTVRAEPDGAYRLSLDTPDDDAARLFTEALDEVLAPVSAPRYVIPRYVLTVRGRWSATLWRLGTLRASTVVYHAVPASLGRTRRHADAFAVAWRRWVSGGAAVYASSPEGAGVLATHRGADPLAATTRLQLTWR